MSLFKILASIYLSKAVISNQKGQEFDEGFTLLELLISGIIVGILAMIAVPAYVATVDKFHYGEAKLQMGCIKRELEAFRMEKGYFPKDVGRDTEIKDNNQVPAGIDCFLTKNTNLTPYNSIYDYENWPRNGGCVVKITFLGKDGKRQSLIRKGEHQISGFYNDRERDRNSDDLILSLGWQPPEVCE